MKGQGKVQKRDKERKGEKRENKIEKKEKNEYLKMKTLKDRPEIRKRRQTQKR